MKAGFGSVCSTCLTWDTPFSKNAESPEECAHASLTLPSAGRSGGGGLFQFLNQQNNERIDGQISITLSSARPGERRLIPEKKSELMIKEAFPIVAWKSRHTLVQITGVELEALACIQRMVKVKNDIFLNTKFFKKGI